MAFWQARLALVWFLRHCLFCAFHLAMFTRPRCMCFGRCGSGRRCIYCSRSRSYTGMPVGLMLRQGGWLVGGIRGSPKAFSLTRHLCDGGLREPLQHLECNGAKHVGREGAIIFAFRFFLDGKARGTETLGSDVLLEAVGCRFRITCGYIFRARPGRGGTSASTTVWLDRLCGPFGRGHLGRTRPKDE